MSSGMGKGSQFDRREVGRYYRYRDEADQAKYNDILRGSKPPLSFERPLKDCKCVDCGVGFQSGASGVKRCPGCRVAKKGGKRYAESGED